MDEFFRVDDLLNFPKEDNILSSTTDHYVHQYHHHHHHHQHYHHQQTAQQFNSPSEHIDHQIKDHYTNISSNHNISNPLRYNSSNNSSFSSVTKGATHFNYDFTDQLCVPNEDVAELEWLSNFVDDTSPDFNTTDITRTLISQSHTSSISIPNAARSKRSRQRTRKASASPISSSTKTNNNSPIDDSTTSSTSSSSSGGVRRCTHCASEKTPQWRTGPMGPKTLCNACGVRYKSGRLVPEYRPAASPTFVLTQHSNSHRKVMELRRQKEVTIKEGHVNHAYRHHRTHDFKVC